MAWQLRESTRDSRDLEGVVALPVKKIVCPILLTVIFVLSGALLGYTYWLYRVEKGNEALLGGDDETAIHVYQEAAAVFAKVPWLPRLLRSDFQSLTFNQVRLLYLRGDSDAAIEKLEEASVQAPFLTETPDYAFWAGNIVVRRALQTKDRMDALDLLKEAVEIYQTGLALQPGDWDLKYNYELVRHLLSLRVKDERKGEEKAKSILEKMRPAADPLRDNLPPEKRG
jgi:tetratricopeptide (TPR) repeat protein